MLFFKKRNVAKVERSLSGNVMIYSLRINNCKIAFWNEMNLEVLPTMKMQFFLYEKLRKKMDNRTVQMFRKVWIKNNICSNKYLLEFDFINITSFGHVPLLLGNGFQSEFIVFSSQSRKYEKFIFFWLSYIGLFSFFLSFNFINIPKSYDALRELYFCPMNKYKSVF